MNYDIEWIENGVYVKLRNRIDDRLIVYVNGLIIGNESFEQINYQIWDFSEVNYYTISSDKGKEVGALDKAASIWNRQTKVAIVTENKLLIDYTKEYIEEITNTAWECKIFQKLEQAKKWIFNGTV